MRLAGTMKILSLGGAKYFVSTLDEYSSYSFLCFLAEKNEAGEEAIDMIQKLENVFNEKIEMLS